MSIKEIAQGALAALFLWVLFVLVFTAGSL
jgi:hypothetical protein